MKPITKLKQILKRKRKQNNNNNYDNDNDSDNNNNSNNICMSESQIKTLLDEARNGNICDHARRFINSLDEKYGNAKSKSKLKIKKKTKKKELSLYDKIVKDWF